MNDKLISIVKLQPKDWRLIREIRLEALTQEPQAFNSTFEEVSSYPESYWEEKMVSKKDIFAFAMCRNRIIGVMNLTIGEDGEAEDVAVVHGAYVTKDFRGLGIGKVLLNFLIDEVTNNNKCKGLFNGKPNSFEYTTVGSGDCKPESYPPLGFIENVKSCQIGGQIQPPPY